MLRAASSVVALVILDSVTGPLIGLINRLDQPPPSPRTSHTGAMPPIEAPKPPEGPAVVTIQAQVKGARLLIDGELHGLTPLDKPLELPDGQAARAEQVQREWGRMTNKARCDFILPTP